MSSKRMDLCKSTFFVLSGVANALGKYLAVEFCRRFAAGSVIVLIESSEELLQEVKKEIQYLERNIEVICCVIDSWQHADAVLFRQLLDTALDATSEKRHFQLAIVLHNEGTGATQNIMEPQNVSEWQTYVQENLYAVVALNQQFLQLPRLANIEKLVVNITSSILVQPLIFSHLVCSCKKARDMYFRAMANEEQRHSKVSVINYSPGIFENHKPVHDLNRNIVNLMGLGVQEKIINLPRVTPLQSSKNLINILEDLSFISGHDVDYYDTYFL